MPNLFPIFTFHGTYLCCNASGNSIVMGQYRALLWNFRSWQTVSFNSSILLISKFNNESDLRWSNFA